MRLHDVVRSRHHQSFRTPGIYECGDVQSSATELFRLRAISMDRVCDYSPSWKILSSLESAPSGLKLPL